MASPRTSEATSNEARGVRVLLVDDEPDWLELASHFLEQAGMSVRTAETVPDALEQLDHDGADVLVSDIGMPNEDGYDLIRQVRRCASPALRTLRALALTAFIGEGYRDQALSSGFNEFRTKPVQLKELVTIIGELAAPVANDASREASDRAELVS
jgi:CheY-like chemotaxis protein